MSVAGKISIHPAVDQGFKKGKNDFTGGVRDRLSAGIRDVGFGGHLSDQTASTDKTR